MGIFDTYYYLREAIFGKIENIKDASQSLLNQDELILPEDGINFKGLNDEYQELIEKNSSQEEDNSYLEDILPDVETEKKENIEEKKEEESQLTENQEANDNLEFAKQIAKKSLFALCTASLTVSTMSLCTGVALTRLAMRGTTVVLANSLYGISNGIHAVEFNTKSDKMELSEKMIKRAVNLGMECVSLSIYALGAAVSLVDLANSYTIDLTIKKANEFVESSLTSHLESEGFTGCKKGVEKYFNAINDIPEKALQMISGSESNVPKKAIKAD